MPDDHNHLIPCGAVFTFLHDQDPQQTSRAEVESSQSPSVQNAEAQAPAVAYGMQPIAGGVHDR